MMWLESAGFVWESPVMMPRRAAAAAALLILLTAGSSAGQAPPANLNGVWQGPYVPDMSRTGRNQIGEPNLPFTPAGEKEWKSYDAANGDYLLTAADLEAWETENGRIPDGAWVLLRSGWGSETSSRITASPMRCGSATPASSCQWTSCEFH